MALTEFQRSVLKVLADRRRLGGESYIAGGVALNEALAAFRRSQDVDVFHDSLDALAQSWSADAAELRAHGFDVVVRRERPTFVEAVVRSDRGSVLVEWSHDSAYRFFPLVAHATLGLTLHPVDLATNKVLALVGRREPRDWVDALACHREVQPLGFLAWAAAGKDPGYSPRSIVDESVRSSRYTQVELDTLDFDGPRPDAPSLAREWHEAVGDARLICEALPAEHAGTCVVDQQGQLVRARPEAIGAMLPQLQFHPGRLGGAFPTLRSTPHP